MRFVFCPTHGWLPAYLRGWPTDRCPLCAALEGESGWAVRELLERGEDPAALALAIITGRWPEERKEGG